MYVVTSSITKISLNLEEKEKHEENLCICVSNDADGRAHAALKSARVRRRSVL